MGDVVSFENHKKGREVKEAISEMDDFYTFYQANIDMVEEIADDLLFDLEAKNVYNSDVFLLRESIMSAMMRDAGIKHPFHTFVDNMIVPLLGLTNPVDTGEDGETDNS